MLSTNNTSSTQRFVHRVVWLNNRVVVVVVVFQVHTWTFHIGVVKQVCLQMSYNILP